MANIRIKDLSTTASTTASDDFFGVDGATNGTRKLNAYSPTFGGNLTVSGTASAGTLTDGYITMSAAQINRTSNFVELQYAASGGVRMFGATATPITFSSTGNLTVSGTGTQTFSGQIYTSKVGASGGSPSGMAFFAGTTVSGSTDGIGIGANAAGAYKIIQSYGGALSINPSGNNFLLGTTTDGGQKLQVAGTGYLSDSLRVGTSWSPLSWGVKAIEVNDAGGGLFAAYYGGSAKGYIIANSGDFAINTQGAIPLLLRTNGSTALTLDSSSNATFAGQIKGNSTQEAQFAGAVRIKNALVADAASAGFLDFISGATRVVSYGANNSTAGTFSLVLRSANSSINSTALSFDTSSNATFAGSIAINNTVQTAAAVVSTHKVTISIGGSTYYLLATNV